MKEPLEETLEICNEGIYAVLKSEEIYDDLIRQRDNLKSYTLKNLLNTELWGYVDLTKTMEKYIRLQFKTIQEEEKDIHTYLKDSLKEVNSIEDKIRALDMFQIVKNTYNAKRAANDISVSVANIAIQNYSNIISRNFKKWEDFAKMLGDKVADLAADTIPVISELKSIYENVRYVAELANKFYEKATDYSETDEKLFEIEEHIIVMKEAENLFQQSIKILESQECK